MSRSYLKRVVFECDSDFIERKSNGAPSSDRDQKLIDQLAVAMGRFVVWQAFCDEELRNARAQVGKGQTELVRIFLTNKPKPDLYFDPPDFPYVDVGYDPLKLLSLPLEKEVWGELTMELVESALQKLVTLPGFPTYALKNASKRFREKGFAYSFLAGEETIQNTKAKGSIYSVVTPAGTERHIVVSYRGKELLRAKTSSVDTVDFSKNFSGFELVGTKLKLIGTHFHPDPAVIGMPDWPDSNKGEIDIENYRRALALFSEKGWV